jgi:hypothetical protein
MDINLSEALGISLSEVQARYIRDSDIGEDLVKEQNYGNVIMNHYRSRRYMIEDIDGILFAKYSSDA